MNGNREIDFAVIRRSMAGFDLSARVEPNDTISLERAFFPDGHRGVLDLKRPLVVGNRGMGKSFWTHALLNQDLRHRLANVYNLNALAKTSVVVGFNGSDKIGQVAPTRDEVAAALQAGTEPDLIWRAVLVRAALAIKQPNSKWSFRQALESTTLKPDLYSETMSELDDKLASEGRTLLIVFDALDRLAKDWDGIHSLTRSLLARVAGLQSFQSIRAKVFMRVDQFEYADLFRFPDSSKIKNGHVNLNWERPELYGLVLFELLRSEDAAQNLRDLAANGHAERALPSDGRMDPLSAAQLVVMMNLLAGEFMGNPKRGRVFTWVPLHLSDAANNCSPRTFLRAWKAAAEHQAPPPDKVVDHLGLIDGVRKASTDRLEELREDYPWIDPALEAMRGQFVPISRDELFDQWDKESVIAKILKQAAAEPTKTPVGFSKTGSTQTLLNAMKSVAVMEERANGKINVPDIFRVEAGIKRKGGVAVPRKS